jgi:hypothetical protein
MVVRFELFCWMMLENGEVPGAAELRWNSKTPNAPLRNAEWRADGLLEGL